MRTWSHRSRTDDAVVALAPATVAPDAIDIAHGDALTDAPAGEMSTGSLSTGAGGLSVQK